MRRVVEDHWLPPADPPAPDPDGAGVRQLRSPAEQASLGARGEPYRPPKGTKTYRRCTIMVKNRKGQLVQCEEAGLVPWELRDDPSKHKGKCKKHGGPK